VVFPKDDAGGQKPKEKKHTPPEVQNAEWRITMINRLEHARRATEWARSMALFAIH
jgi:hypothetical protein